MEKKRLLGIDFGTKRIGIAMTDESQTIAQPFCVIKREGTKKDVEKIMNIVRQYKVYGIVVGVALDNKGKLTLMGQKAMAFANILKDQGLEVFFVEESMTTIMAHQSLTTLGLKEKKQKYYVDKIAATIILQDFLKGAIL